MGALRPLDPVMLSAALCSGGAGSGHLRQGMRLGLPAGGRAEAASTSPAHAGLGGPRVQREPAALGSGNRGTPACASGESQWSHRA